MIFSSASNDYLMHYGIRGQKWGIRRYQNPDGTLTEEGKIHYGFGDYSKKKPGFFNAKRTRKKVVKGIKESEGFNNLLNDYAKDFSEVRSNIIDGVTNSMTDKDFKKYVKGLAIEQNYTGIPNVDYNLMRGALNDYVKLKDNEFKKSDTGMELMQQERIIQDEYKRAITGQVNESLGKLSDKRVKELKSILPSWGQGVSIRSMRYTYGDKIVGDLYNSKAYESLYNKADELTNAAQNRYSEKVDGLKEILIENYGEKYK